MYKYKFDKTSKKYPCPDCTKKCFVRYVDADNSLLPEHFGRCDREVNCGYWKKPDQNDVIDLKPIKKQKKLPPSYIDESIVQRSLSHYHINSLFNYLTTKFDKTLVLQTFQKYRVGTSKHWCGSTVFWLTDQKGLVSSGKILKYVDGHRLKTPFNHITWVHKLLKIENFHLEQVMFGIHLLNSYKGEIVCVVESEKTALVMDLFCPTFLWLSIGSLSMLNYDRLKCLKGHTIVLFPDTDGNDKWCSKADLISQQMSQKIYVSDLVVNRTLTFDKNDGYDLADLVLEETKRESLKENELIGVIERMIANNSAVDLLIKTFDLDISKAVITKRKSSGK